MKLVRKKTKVVLGISGSIAAYKSAELARYLITHGCEVRVVMTDSAAKFVTPFTLEVITGKPVTNTFWNETESGAIGHIELADWADVLLIAPASADLIAKLSYGFAESPLLAVALATKAPVVVAPAMNVNMYDHPATIDNIMRLQQRGVHFVEPDSGPLACGWLGRGRLADQREIFLHLRRAVAPQDLAGKRVLISTGPTREAIDPVRYISNRSSGKMGIQLAKEAYRRGAEVTLVHGPLGRTPYIPRDITCVAVTSAAEMYEAMTQRAISGFGAAAEQFDIVITTAAVADYTPAEPFSKKIKKSNEPRALELKATIDILKSIGIQKGKTARPFLVGFAVETGDEEELLNEVRHKLSTKNADLMVGNLAHEAFDHDTNRVWIVSKDGKEEQIGTAHKAQISRSIVDSIVRDLPRNIVTK